MRDITRKSILQPAISRGFGDRSQEIHFNGLQGTPQDGSTFRIDVLRRVKINSSHLLLRAKRED